MPLPMLAQVAVNQARVVAKNIRLSIKKKPLKTFHYHSKGSMVSVGAWFAIGEIFSMKIAGKLTWWIWRTLYLFKFFSWKKRLHIVIDWTLDALYPRDITKLHSRRDFGLIKKRPYKSGRYCFLFRSEGEMYATLDSSLVLAGLVAYGEVSWTTHGAYSREP